MPKSERWFIDLSDEKLYINLTEALQKIKDGGFSFSVQIKDLLVSLRDHPGYIESNKLHRFTPKTKDGQDTESKPLKACVFDDIKIITD